MTDPTTPGDPHESLSLPSLPFPDDPIPEPDIPVLMPVDEDEAPLPLASVPHARRASARSHDEVDAPRRRVRYPRRRRRHSFTPILVTIACFGVMMAVSVAHIVYSVATAVKWERMKDAEIRTLLIRETAVVEGVDTLLVLGCLAVAGWPRFRRNYGAPLLAWLFAWPGLVLCLAINIGYSLGLQAIFKPDPAEEFIDIGLADGAWAILLVCLQPAVVEELFFRGLLLGHLRHHLGTHGAVWVSSVLFGIAHLGNPIAWPVLVLLGVGLGYTRIASRGLVLPMILHFLHNLVVIVLDDTLL